ncbi:MAG: TerB family tellurite resistance protein [Myxococcales bacterium]|nr:TerB family tellurite resistance protein [Myxococcales bacterium]MCB9531160.1 TerB family tellurite resistance protein [Myxococcales bacterium]
MSTEEENYFHQQEMERREARRRELERAAAELAERRRVAETLETHDEALLERIRALGFDGDTARVLDLLPLIHVAWADGSVSQKERTQIFRALTQRGIARDSEAWLLVAALLEQRPSDDFLEETLHLLRDLGGERGVSIVDLCAQIARSSGGFFGLGDKIADEEYAVIAHIADELGESAKLAFEQQLG